MQELERVTREERAEALAFLEDHVSVGYVSEDGTEWSELSFRPDGRLMCGHAPEQHPTEHDAASCRDRGW
jgi:hypothetical protein